MKQILAVLLAAAFCVALGACGNNYAKYDQLIGYLESGDYEAAQNEIERLESLREAEDDTASTDTAKVTAVQITSDNWDDYFEIVREETPVKNDFGETERMYVDNYFKLKDGFTMAERREGSETSIALEYSYTKEYRFFEVNKETGEVTLGERNEEQEPRPETGMKTIGYDKTALVDSHTYSTEGGWVGVDIDFAIIRAQGTLYLVEK